MIFSQRDLSWDFVKFVLMFFILYGHFCPAGEEWTPVTRIIGLYVIPGFFFVSGYFQTQVRNFSSLIEKMKRLLMRIVLPMLSWGSIYVFISLLQSLYRGDITDAIDVYQFFKYSPFYVMGFYWFFTAMLFCVILGTLLSWIRGKNTYLYLFLLFASPFFLCIVSQPFFEKYHFSFVWLFYVVGMFYRQLAERFSSDNIIWDILFFVLLITIIIIGVNYEPQHTFYYKSNLIRNSSINFVVWRYVIYLAATSSVIYGLRKFYIMFEKSRIVNRLALFGADTLFIYCSHMLVLVFMYRPILMPYLFNNHAGWNVRILEHAIGIIVSILLYLILQKLCLYCKQLRWLRVFFMGI